MTMHKNIEAALHDVVDLKTFVDVLLRNQLGWPIEQEVTQLDDIAFEWTEDELKAKGLSKHLTEGKIFQIQPLVDDQTWGIFVLEFKRADVFTKERGTTRILREVLRGLVGSRDKRADQKTWQPDQILFICTHQYQHFRFAHFKKPTSGKGIATIATFGWGHDIPARTACEFNLPALKWPAEPGKAGEWIRAWSNAFNIEKVTRRFYDDYEEVFTLVEGSLKSQLKNDEERRKYTQMLFNRLMFLRFVERKGWLKFDGKEDYLRQLHAAGPIGNKSFFKSRIEPLFFKALAEEGYQDDVAIGQVHFLNGGLFLKHELDNKVIDIKDAAFEPIIGEQGLFYRYNFTVEESTPLNINVAVDPEMLGKVFEKLVTGRHESGSYYTPRTVVSFMCREALKGYLGGFESLVDEHDAANIKLPQARELLRRLSEVKVVDPACGSGAYLLGMLNELHTLKQILQARDEEMTPEGDYELKLKIIQNNLYGVDLDDFAVNIARLRLWLALAVDFKGKKPQPLPNLDFKIEQGDSLVSPNPQGNYDLAQSIILEVARLKSDHSRTTKPERKAELEKQVTEKRKEIAKWVRSGQKVESFDWGVDFAEVFLPRNPEATVDGEIPLGDKLAAQTQPGGFDIVLANPPYGIKCEDPLRFNFFPRKKDKDGKQEEPQSKDSYGLFMARALQLLKPGGHFTYIVSDTWRTIRSHRPLRKKLLEETQVLHLMDLPSWIFDATVNTCIITANKQKPGDQHKLIAADLRNLPSDQWNTLEANLRAIAGHGVDVQTTEYARYTYEQELISTYNNFSFFIGSPELYRLMSDPRFTKLGDIAEVKQGLATADNKYYLRRRPEARGSYDIIDDSKILTDAEIKNLTQDEKLNGVDLRNYGGRHFVPYDKGGESDTDEGWLPNYYVPTQYFIDWSMSAVKRLRTATIADIKRSHGDEDKISPGDEERIASRFQNSEYYFREGITFSRTGIYAPTFRIGSSSCFDSKSDGLFADRIDQSFLLSILCSLQFRYLFKIYQCHTVQAEGDAMEAMPVCMFASADSQKELSVLADAIIAKQREDGDYSFHSDEQSVINEILYRVIGFTQDDIREIELWYCRRYPKLAEAQNSIVEVKQKYADYLAHCELVMSKPPSYWRSHPILQLVVQGEGPQLEFKETLDYDVKTGQKNGELVKSALKTIAAFLNTTGGTLLIGVTDSGEIKGLERDFALCHKHDKDGFEQKLRNLVNDRFEPKPHNKIDLSFEQFPEGMICRVAVTATTDITHFDKDIYIRDGNLTRKLDGPALTKWVQDRRTRI